MKLPGYIIHELIGEGGMAKVYLATQESLDRQVALKVMNPTLQVSDKVFCERFYKEGKIIARLNHPGIVTIHDIGCHEPYYYMAMEYCGAGTLKQRIAQGMAREQVVQVMRQMASALGYAHSLGIVHRDVKPANILFKDNGAAVLSDFGIAKAMDSHTQLTAVGFAVGTPEYMSPEQASGRRLEPGSDLYSLGVVLYEMLTAKKPYLGSDALSTAILHLKEPVPVLPLESGGFQDLLERLLAKTPDKRFASAEQLIAELDRMDGIGATEGQATREIAQAGEADSEAKIDRGKGKGAKVPVAVLFVLLSLAIGTAWWLFYERPPADDIADLPEPPSISQPISLETASNKPPGKVARLLEFARAHRDVGRVREPPGSNAYETYQMVLELDPDNQEAKAAMDEIERLSPE